MRTVLLDANLLIGAFDTDEQNQAHLAAKQQLVALLQDPDVKLALNPLIRYEVLRGAKRVKAKDLDAALNQFHEFDIRGADARRAAEIFKLAKDSGMSPDKRQFDIFHFTCAELNQLELASQDGDLGAIANLVKKQPSNAQA